MFQGSKMKFIKFLVLLLIVNFIPTSAGFSRQNVPVWNLQEDPYLAFAEEMPAPVGGLEGVYKKIVYPEIAKKAGLEGKVYLLVYVNENGGADDVKVIKGIGGGCEEAASKVLKDAKYTPGKNKGVPVKVKLSLAITFKLK